MRGERRVAHPVRPAGWWVSVRLQAGNADDVLMRLRHGPGWRRRVGGLPGRRAAHLVTTGAAVLAVTATVLRRRPLARLAAALWLGATAELVWRRIAPGPRTAHEIARMVTTSAAIPIAATYHWLHAWLTQPPTQAR